MRSVNLYCIHVQMSAEVVKMNYKNTELQKRGLQNKDSLFIYTLLTPFIPKWPIVVVKLDSLFHKV